MFPITMSRNAVKLITPNSLVTLAFLSQTFLSFLIAWGWLPRLPLSLVFLALLFVSFLVSAFHVLRKIPQLSSQILQVDRLFLWLLLLWVTAIQVFYYFELASVYPEDYMRLFGTAGIGAWSAAVAGSFMAGASFAYKLSAWIIQLFTILLGVFMAWQVTGQLYFLYYNPTLLASDPDSFKANYLLIGDMLAVTSIIFLGSFLKRGWTVGGLAIYIFSLGALFVSFSRGSLFFGGISLSLLWLFGTRRLLHFLTAIGVSAVGVGFIFASLEAQSSLLAQMEVATGRVASLLEGEDASFNERKELLSESLDYLSRYWLLGKFMYEVTDGPGLGLYVHNWLSFWLEYGVGPFILSLALFFYLLIRSWRRRADVEVSLLIFALLAVAFARAYVWVHFWFILAYVIYSLDRLPEKGR